MGRIEVVKTNQNRDMASVNTARKLELLLPRLITQLGGTVGGIASLYSYRSREQRDREGIAEYRELLTLKKNDRNLGRGLPMSLNEGEIEMQ